MNTEMHTASIVKVSVSSDGLLIATGSNDKTVKIWNSESGNLLHTIRVPLGDTQEGRIYTVALSPDGSQLAVGGYTSWCWYGEMSVYIFDVQSGEMTKRVGGFSNCILMLNFLNQAIF